MKKLLMTAALAAVALGASAQTWPDKAVTMVVPFPPGGSTDQVARAVAPLLTEKFKQSFLVDNKAGATGTSAPPSCSGLQRTATPSWSPRWARWLSCRTW